MSPQVSQHPTAASTPVDLHEARLLSGLLQDEAWAWREFNVQYSKLIYRCISKITAKFRSVVAADDVAEIYSSFCVQLLANDKRKLRSFDPSRGSKLGTWLVMLANHCAYDFLREQRRTPRLETHAVETQPDSTPTPFDSCYATERARILSALVEDLSDKDQQFVRLYFGQGLEAEAVAATMGISVKTVYSKKHKIRTRLEGLLGKRRVAA